VPIELRPEYFWPGPGQKPQRRPVAIYLPGLDGSGISSATYQYNDLAQAFELWRMSMQPTDRSSFGDVVDAVVEFINERRIEVGESGGRSHPSIVLIGESMGGLIAAATALRFERKSSRNTTLHKSPLAGLVLINPATSIDQTLLDVWVPLLTALDTSPTMSVRPESAELGTLTPYAVLGSLVLSALIPDNDQRSRIVQSLLNTSDLQFPPRSLRQVQLVYEALISTLGRTADRLPAGLLEHRLRWLTMAAPVVNSRLSRISIPTIVIAGDSDQLLPSSDEASRLVDAIPNCEKLVVPGRGHFVLDSNVNLTEAIVFSNIDPLGKKQGKPYDPILDWNLPNPEEIQRDLRTVVGPVREQHSPVFFTTDKNGKRWKNLVKFPSRDSNSNPILLVGNHQFAASDLSLLVAELLKQKGMIFRGLAHPVVFRFGQGRSDLGGRQAGIIQSTGGDGNNPFAGQFGNLQKYGAVLVSPFNYYRLLQSGQNVLLFPGGAKEALVGNRSYPLFWPDQKVDFVRTAARFNATIIPLSAIGMVDGVTVLVEPEDLVKLPIIGDRARAAAANMTAARYDAKNEDEVVFPPIFLPGVPRRNYFLFGRPVSTENVDPNDRVACSNVYNSVRNAVREGIDDLLQARKHDMFDDTARRIAYERLFQKQAPTFPIDKLN
jgi:pimeloyl-ACP methyl ester carboxylesterase